MSEFENTQFDGWLPGGDVFIDDLYTSARDPGKGKDISKEGLFYSKGTADLMQQAAQNINSSGEKKVVVEVDADKLWDGTPNYRPEEMLGVRVTNETRPGDLSEFWKEVKRLEAEATEKSASH